MKVKKGLLLLIFRISIYYHPHSFFSVSLVFLGTNLALKVRTSNSAIEANTTNVSFFFKFILTIRKLIFVGGWAIFLTKTVSFNSIAIENCRKKGIILLFRFGFSITPSCCSWMYVPRCRLLFVSLMTRLKKSRKRHHRMTIQTRS